MQFRVHVYVYKKVCKHTHIFKESWRRVPVRKKTHCTTTRQHAEAKPQLKSIEGANEKNHTHRLTYISHTHTCTLTHIYLSHTHTDSHISHTHTHTHMPAHTLMYISHTHTHTHTPPPPDSPSKVPTQNLSWGGGGGGMKAEITTG